MKANAFKADAISNAEKIAVMLRFEVKAYLVVQKYYFENMWHTSI